MLNNVNSLFCSALNEKIVLQESHNMNSLKEREIIVLGGCLVICLIFLVFWSRL